MIKLLSLITLGIFGYSMKPAPFTQSTNISQQHLPSGMHIESTRDDASDSGYSPKGTTVLYEKKIVWNANVFIGRRDYELSPDGKLMFLFGSAYYTKKTSTKGVFVEIYEDGKLEKSINLTEVVGNVNTYAQENDLHILGGGWISSKKLMDSMFIDWESKVLEFVISKNQKKKFEFKYL